ncbi:transposase [cyanobacterium endosymbiont of Epithemia turgida]|nr:transposase [cyanobacterium endosymbiont of Epithemia turgida]
MVICCIEKNIIYLAEKIEGINNKFEVDKKRAYGLRKFVNFKL